MLGEISYKHIHIDGVKFPRSLGADDQTRCSAVSERVIFCEDQMQEFPFLLYKKGSYFPYSQNHCFAMLKKNGQLIGGTFVELKFPNDQCTFQLTKSSELLVSERLDPYVG